METVMHYHATLSHTMETMIHYHTHIHTYTLPSLHQRTDICTYLHTYMYIHICIHIKAANYCNREAIFAGSLVVLLFFAANNVNHVLVSLAIPPVQDLEAIGVRPAGFVHHLAATIKTMKTSPISPGIPVSISGGGNQGGVAFGNEVGLTSHCGDSVVQRVEAHDCGP